MRHILNYLLYSFIIVFFTACGGGGGTTLTSITSFEASATTIAKGSSVNLTAVFTNGTASINNGVGAVSSNTAKRVTPTATTTYTLRVTNSLGASITSSVRVNVLPAYNIFPPEFFDGTYSNDTVDFSGSDAPDGANNHTATLLEESNNTVTTFQEWSVKTINETLVITRTGFDPTVAISQQYWTTDLNNLKYVGYFVGANDVATATSSSIMPITTYIGDSGTMGTYERSVDGSTFIITWKLVADTDTEGNAKYITTTVSSDAGVNPEKLYTATVTSSINQAGIISNQTIVIIYHYNDDRTLTLTSTEP